MATISKADSHASWKELSAEANSDRRKERRINLAFPIELFGFDSSSHCFTEHTVTVNVSSGGCQFPLKDLIDARTVVVIRVTPPEGTEAFPQKPALFLISWVKRAGDKWAVGAAALRQESIWPIAVPDKTAARAATQG